MRILPGVLKELSKHVPTVLFETVEWSELAAELPKISRRILSKDGYDDLFQSEKVHLDPYDIVLTNETPLNRPLVKNRWAGEKILTLYFAQLFSHQGLFLDLRMNHFSDENTVLKWNPTAFWTQFGEAFREGLLKVYDGFYLENDELYYQGLEEIGLLKADFKEADKKILGDLFREQFGGVQNEEMKFNLEHFRTSIIKMSDFMLKKKVKISKDFLYLGIYLVTLYSTLEAINEPLPVKQVYLSVRGRFNAKEIR